MAFWETFYLFRLFSKYSPSIYMQEITYTVNHDHLVSYQMFHTYATVATRRKRKMRPLIFSVLCVLLGLFYYFQDSHPIAYGFWGVAAFAFFAYRGLIKKRYLAYYKNFLDQQRGVGYEEQVTLRHADDGLYTQTDRGQGTLPYSEVRNIVELADIYILRLQNENAIVIPNDNSDTTAFINTLSERSSKQIENYSGYRWS